MRLALLLPVVGLPVVGAGCLGEEPAPEAVAPPSPAWVGVLELRLEPVHIAEGVARPEETAGLAMALLERRLGDLEGVAARVEGLPARPALAWAVAPEERWRLAVRVEGEGEEIRLNSQLCDPLERCLDNSVPAEWGWPGAATTATVAWVGARLGRRFLGSTETWAAPESRDPYALLILGRAAATVYGLRAAPDPEERDDPRRDPLARSVFLDPTMATGWYLRARSPLSGPEGTRRQHAERASALDPGDPLLVADAASLALMAGDPALALPGLESLQGVAPDDLRFPLALAEAALLADAPETSRRVAFRLRNVPAADPERLSLEVRIAEATNSLDGPQLDRLLQEWAIAADQDPEPVQRRVDQRVAAGDLAGALELMPELQARAPGEATRAQEMALALALGQHERAATLADELGRVEIAAAMRALRDLNDPAAAANHLAASGDPGARLARGWLLFRAGRTEEAAQIAQAELELRPWEADALALGVQAWRAQGREEEALALALRLGQVDPLHRLALAPSPVAE